MGYKIGIFTLCLFLAAQVLWAQCDDDDDLPPSGSFEVQGGGSCGSATFRLKFTLSSSDDDDDDDNDDRFNLSYQIGAQTFQLSGVADGHEVEHTINSSTTATFLTLTFGSCTANIDQSLSLEVFAAPSQNISTTNPACNQNNGTIVSTGTGGNAPYEFSLNGSSFQSSGRFNNLAAGNYTIEVRDANGCTNTQNRSLTSASTPNISINNVTQPGCGQNNGSFSAQAAGGASPYQFSLNGGNFQSASSFSNLAAGSYTVTVRDANGCTGSRSQSLASPSAPSLSIATPLQPSCNEANGAFTAQASGGTAPYQFALNNGALQSNGRFGNLAAGTYTVSVRDAQGCTASITTTLQAPASPRPSVSSTRQPSCAGNDGQIQVQAQGGQAPYTYALNGGVFQNNAVFASLVPGTYRISVRDSRGCEGSLQVVLNSANGNLAPATISGNAGINACLLEDIRLQGNLPAGTTGRWTMSTNLGTLSNAQNAQTTFKPTRAGTVEAIWTLSAAGCANYSQAKILINVATAPVGKDFPGVEVNKDAVSVPLYTGSNLYEMDVLRQGKKGSANIGVDHVLLYTPKAGENGPDTVYYTICAAECPNACDTNWVAFVLTNEDAICELEKIDPRVVFPEGITPNDDGYNDALIFNIVDKLGCPSNYAQSDITIFNRWADKVFVQEPYENQWKGTTRDGGALPPGVYYYVLRIRPEGRKEFVKFGSVSIFK